MFPLNKEIASVSFCSLHGEMRNTEQLLGSIVFFCVQVQLKECNIAISNYGQEISRGKDRITVKLRQGKQTAVTKSNVCVASFLVNI